MQASIKITSAVLAGMPVVAFVALALTVAGARPSDSDPAVAAADEAPAATVYKFVGSKECRMCHPEVYESFAKSPKGRSWTALAPGESRDVKLAAGLDVKVDYRRDARCLACHSVGYGRPGGYVIPKPGDKRSTRYARKRQGVGCESCHGAGSGFVPIMRDIFHSGRDYRIEELRAKGQNAVGPATCGNCHNEQAICMVGVRGSRSGSNESKGSRVSRDGRAWLHVDIRDREGFHAKFPLEQRIPDGAVRDKLSNEQTPEKRHRAVSPRGKSE